MRLPNCGRRTRNRLFGLRSHRAEPARRPSGAAADAAALSAGRTPADRAGRRRHRDDRRPARDRRTHAQHRRHRRRLGRPDPGPVGTVRRVRRLADRRRRREQPVVDRGVVGDRVPPRRRQALLGERHARPRHGAATSRRRRHLLHRIQLHAAAGQRLRGTEPAVRLLTSGRRLRPVGQHHRRRPAGPAEDR